MLSAKRFYDGKTVFAYFERESNAPFVCLDCGKEVQLRSGSNRVNHFAHVNPRPCKLSRGESDEHRVCKKTLYLALLRDPRATDVTLEHHLGPVRPDVFLRLNGTPVAIEIQISSLSLETILNRTRWYARQGICVLWLVPWKASLLNHVYSPTKWERWLHALYFGRVYYWISDLTVASYHFEHIVRAVPEVRLFTSLRRSVVVGGYSRRLKRQRKPVRNRTLHLLDDFIRVERRYWQTEEITIPDCAILADAQTASNQEIKKRLN